MKKIVCLVALAGAFWGSNGLAAKILDSSRVGFTIYHQVEVKASAAEAYTAFVERIGEWWESSHTYSGNAANMSIHPVVGGCLCEALPDGGHVRHLDVVYVAPGQSVRFVGGLGPLEAMAANGSSMGWTFTPLEGGGTRIELTYIVSGYSPKGMASMAAPVDGVLGTQVAGLAKLLGT
ncbi:MAG: ATPase [Bacteroidota bacterium]